MFRRVRRPVALAMAVARVARRTTLSSALVLVAALPTLANAQAINRPFKATLLAQEVLGFDRERCPDIGFVGYTEGRGQASQLGQLSLKASDCPIPQGMGQLLFSDGKLTLTAANGDQLQAVYFGQVTPRSSNVPAARIEGSFTVIGGTGRFQGARGSGRLTGIADMSNPQMMKAQYEAEGHIRY